MSAGLTWPMLGLLTACIAAETVRELCFKTAADGATLAEVLRQRLTWLGIAFWFGEYIAWTRVLEDVPLSIAYPMLALVYIAIVLSGAVVLHERVGRRHAIGAILITTGVACIGATGL